MTDITQETIKRMENLARSLAGGFYMRGLNENGVHQYDIVAEAGRIVAALPKPADSDLIEAREIVALAFEWLGNELAAKSVREGGHDRQETVKRALAAIKRGLQSAE